jgi:hypothetical protein
LARCWNKQRGNELNIRIGDLERYGRTLLLDGVCRREARHDVE